MRYQLSEIKSLAVTREDLEKVRAIEWHINGENSDAPVSKRKIIPHIVRGRCVWFSWEDETLKQLFNKGLGDKDIAAALKLTVSAIGERRRKLSLIRKKNLDHDALSMVIRRMSQETLSTKDVTKELGISTCTLYAISNKHGIYFKKTGSDSALSKVSKVHRAAICQLHDLGFNAEIMSLAFPYSRRTIYGVLYATPSSETVDLASVPEAVELLSCKVSKPGSRITPAECLLMEEKGFDAFIATTGRSEDSALINFFYKNNRYEHYHQLANNMRELTA